MTFDDVEEVNVDFQEGTFVIIRKNGNVNGAYGIDEERDLWDRIVSYRDQIPIYAIADIKPDLSYTEI